ncbi:peptide deformylase [Haploplasma axanthum]|uniref:Peptide deformylase n=1 Tax=Haploplasma axanthum TaxID=29552 RepID=A0A449BFK6_HAPAX|nr:peptide deformylase [Haploplasma axanthum]VEU81224.1 formylmethionine deformylase [Haploplasma axanthum]
MILMDDIIREGHPTLTKKAKEVTLPLSINDKKILKEMLEFVKNSQDDEIATEYDLRPGVGIAAPQINISKRMFVIYVEDFNGILYEYALINPVLTVVNNSEIYVPGGEGCLSVDRVTKGLTPRYQEINIKALRYDVASDLVIPIELNVSGYVAIVFQHEYDHIEGIMFTDKLYDELPNAKPAFEIISPED